MIVVGINLDVMIKSNKVSVRHTGAISNGNRTEWSPIRSVIIRVTTESDDCCISRV